MVGGENGLVAQNSDKSMGGATIRAMFDPSRLHADQGVSAGMRSGRHKALLGSIHASRSLAAAYPGSGSMKKFKKTHFLIVTDWKSNDNAHDYRGL